MSARGELAFSPAWVFLLYLLQGVLPLSMGFRPLPLVVTGVAQGLVHDRANGSETTADGRVVGSSLIGQQGYGLVYFEPHPARGLGENTVDTRYDPLPSGVTNRAADSRELVSWLTGDR